MVHGPLCKAEAIGGLPARLLYAKAGGSAAEAFTGSDGWVCAVGGAEAAVRKAGIWTATQGCQAGWRRLPGHPPGMQRPGVGKVLYTWFASVLRAIGAAVAILASRTSSRHAEARC